MSFLDWLGGALDWLGDRFNDIFQFGRDLVNYATHPGDLLDALKRVAELAADADLGFLLGGLLGEDLLTVADLLGFSTVEQLYNFLRNLRPPRSLHNGEVALVNQVFNTDQVTVPPEKVLITPVLGFMGKPFTVPVSLVGTVLNRLGAEVAGPLYLLAQAYSWLNRDKYFVNLDLFAYDFGADS